RRANFLAFFALFESFAINKAFEPNGQLVTILSRTGFFQFAQYNMLVAQRLKTLLNHLIGDLFDLERQANSAVIWQYNSWLNRNQYTILEGSFGFDIFNASLTDRFYTFLLKSCFE